MKKLIIITTILLLTGCFGEVSKGYITKECKKEESANKINIKTNIKLKSNEGNLENLIISEKYETNKDITSIINSKKSESNMYKNEKGITIEINNNEIIYNIDVINSSDLVKERFNLEEKTHKMIKKLEEKNYTCK